jgi:TolB-like protein/thioredoxin-like negative regulator of GroEL
MAGRSFLGELRRRKVLQSAAIYGAVAWGVTEIIVTVVEQLFLPQWVSTLTVILFVVGFPVAMFLAWTFDFTSEGIRRTAVTSRRGRASILFSLALLVAGTAGLFFLIRPTLEQRDAAATPIEIPPNSVAVLPFENAGLDPGDSHLSEGLSDEIRDALGRVSGLRVAARSSSRVALQRRLSALEVSEQLRVANIVEGSMRRQGGRLRVSVQLIEGRSGLAVWSEVFERAPGELLMVQQAIAEALAGEILPDSPDIASEPATRDPTANELMLLARHYEQRVQDRGIVDADLLQEAVRLYRQATEADPKSALAHGRLAGALVYLGDLDAAEASITQAILLNPNLSEVQNTLGEVYWALGRAEAGTAFARAVELNPNNADALHNYAYIAWLSVAGRTSGVDPLPLFRRARDLDPLSLTRHAALGEYLAKDRGLVEEVRSVIADIQGLFDDAESYRAIGLLYELIGEVDKAIAWTIRARDLEPGNPDHRGRLAELFAIIGDAETTLQLEPNPSVGLLFWLRRYEELIDIAEFRMIENPEEIEIRYLLAFAYVATGQFESAIHVLSSTGLPNTVLNDRQRSVAEIEAFYTLINALDGAGRPDTVRLAESLAVIGEEDGWWGDVGWVGVFRGCNFAILDRRDDALRALAQSMQSPMLRRMPLLRDSWCFQRYRDEPMYEAVLRDQEERRARLRERLPATLAEFGVQL